jgi:hypothetical protein
MARVFISHRGCDSVPAERLALEIRQAGHDVWLDAWEFSVGRSIIDRMNDGLSKATHLLLCYSSSGVDTEWIKREWQPALALQLSGKNIRVLPVCLTGGEPPAILADIYYLDLVSNWNAGIQNLLTELGRFENCP